MKPTAAMVLAAGRGVRMRPLSDAVPKPALPLVNEPVIAAPLRLAASSGATRVVVNTWHLADAMAAAARSVDLPAEILVSRETELMGTAGGLALARDRGLLGTRGPVLVVNGDGVLNLELDAVLSRMAEEDDLVTLALLPHLDPGRWSRVELDAHGRVSRIAPPGAPADGEVPFVYPGVMVVSRTVIDRLPSRPGSIPDQVWRPARRAGRMGGVVVSGWWREIGTPDAYLDGVVDRLSGRTVVHPSAEVSPTAVVGPALVGRHARIGADAVVGETVVAEGASVGAGCRVLRSVLLGRVDIRPGETVTDTFRAGPVDPGLFGF